MIQLTNLRIEKGGSPILDEVSLSFDHGGITALIGPNGAGKSTLLHAIAGLVPPARGVAMVEGLDMAQARPPERARQVALLAQDERVTARLTVHDLIGFGRWTHHNGRPRDEDRAVVDRAMEIFNLGALADRRLDTLSGGQRQRAFVAMAWAQEAPWLLLDEPLSALDPRHARDIMDLLHSLTRPGPAQRSVVIVLHDLGVAARYADRIVALKDGRVVAAGPREIAMQSDMLSELFGTGLAIENVRGRDVVVPV